MILFIQLTTAGTDTGPFNLYSDVDGYISAFEMGVSKVDLLSGYTSYVVPDGTTSVRVMSAGICTNYVDFPVSTTTTTTTINLCSCITFDNSTASPINVFWTPCVGFFGMDTVAPFSTLQVCGNTPVCDTPGLTCSIGDPCFEIDPFTFECTTTTTTTVI